MSNEDLSPIIGPTFRFNRPKKKSQLRKSVLSDDVLPEDTRSSAEDEAEDASQPAITVTRRPPNTSRISRPQGLSHSSASASRAPSSSSNNPRTALLPRSRDGTPPVHLPRDSASQTHTPPSYSAAYLAELKSSTPSTPASRAEPPSTLSSDILESLTLSGEDAFELTAQASLLGSPHAPTSTSILSNFEIQEKLSRRARLAAEHEAAADDTSADFLSLDPRSTSSSHMTTTYASSSSRKPPPSRLTRPENDDMNLEDPSFSNPAAPDLDLLGTSGRPSSPSHRRRLNTDVSRAADQLAASTRRAQIAAAIDLSSTAGAPASGSDAASDSESERLLAFERLQARHGTLGQKTQAHQEAEEAAEARRRSGRAQTPVRIVPVPTLSGILKKVELRIEELERKGKGLAVRRAEVLAEREYCGRRMGEVQRGLREVGERYEALGLTAGEGAGGGAGVVDGGRGLESLGGVGGGESRIRERRGDGGLDLLA